MDKNPHKSESLRVGDFVRMTQGKFQNVRAVIESIDGATTVVRFIIFGRDYGTETFPTNILEKVATLDPEYPGPDYAR